jgi:hypothetical protein
MHGLDVNHDPKEIDAWFRAFFIEPDSLRTAPHDVTSHRSKPWESFQNDLRRASRGCAGRFIEGREDGFGLEDGNWYYTFMGGRQQIKEDGSRVWSELGRHSVSYGDMASSIIGDMEKWGVLIVHVSYLVEDGAWRDGADDCDRKFSWIMRSRRGGSRLLRLGRRILVSISY